ncbi:MAG: glycosyltransferase family 1 protein [Chloroflexi bacterium]|nr:MAG: glycosyltransferase family 1 protein [Chloroflexota bacterium]
MRIGLVIYGRLSTVSGGYLYDRMLVAHLVRHGHEVELISLPDGWGYGRSMRLNFDRSLQQRLENGPWDILLQDELCHPALFWLNRRLSRRPLVTVVHHLRSTEARPAWQNWLYRWVERPYLASVDGFIYNSQTTRQEVEKLVGKRPFVVAPPSGHRFPHHPQQGDILARAHQSGELRLLFVGNLIPRKGLHTLLKALTHLPASGWRLDVVGNTAVNPHYTRTIQQQIRAHGWQARVTLHGLLDDHHLADRYAHSHALVVPSTYEGFGIVYLEGMGFGLPAIATTAGAAGEIITHGQNGFLIPPEDARQLAHHLAAWLTDRSLLARMSLAAWHYFQMSPDWETTMSRTRLFLESLHTHYLENRHGG